MGIVKQDYGEVGGMTKTLLWTNPNPTSNFNDSSVTLSESYLTYKYIVIEYKMKKSTSVSYELFSTVDDFTNHDESEMNIAMGAYCDGKNRVREMHSGTDAGGQILPTTIYISGAYYWKQSHGQDDQYLIPLNIYGAN